MSWNWASICNNCVVAVIAPEPTPGAPGDPVKHHSGWPFHSGISQWETSLCHRTGGPPAGQTPGTAGSPAIPVLSLTKTPRASHSLFHLLSSPSPTEKCISQGLLSREVTKSTVPGTSQEAAFSEGRDRPSLPALTQPVVRAQRSFRWFKCVIITLVPSHTSIRAARTHVPSGSALFAPFRCVTMANEGNVQLPALSHCHPPKNKCVPDCSFTGATEHAAQYSP